MQESTTREKVLKKIRNALIHKTTSPFPQVDFDSTIYNSQDENREVVFASRLMHAGGHFIFCENKFEFAEHLIALAQKNKWENIVCPDEGLAGFLKDCEFPFVPAIDDFKSTETVITLCECLIARTGSILLSSRQAHGRKLPAIAQTHIVVAYKDDLVDDIKNALQLMRVKYKNKLPSMLSVITGPSKTADIELIQITGAHGPVSLFVFLIEADEEIIC